MFRVATMSERDMIKFLMAGLIARVGGVDAAAATIEARLGHGVSKGSITKRQAGQLDWSLLEIMALEDAVGDDCVNRWRNRDDAKAAAREEWLALLSDMNRETSEVNLAGFEVARGLGCKIRTLKEVEDAMAVLERMRSHLSESAA